MNHKRPLSSGCCFDVNRLIEIVSNAGLGAFGGLYNDEIQPISITIGTDEIVPLSSTMPSKDVTYEDDSIVIEEAGIYEINYYLYANVEVGALVTTAVRVNGDNIDSTVISRLVDVDLGTIYSGSTIVELEAGDVIDMAISALLDIEVTLGTGVNASLTIKKIG